MAIDFFNRAGTHSDVVAMILPRTARKAWFQNKLDQRFHLEHEERLPDDAFLFCGQPYTVPAVFQIWERRVNERQLWPVATKHRDFHFFKSSDGAEFAIRRVGGWAGRVLDDLGGSPSFHHFIRPVVHGVKSIIIELEPQFRAIAADVAGYPSLAQSEIVRLYQQHVGQRS